MGNYRNLVWTIFGCFILLGLVYATTTITNTQLTTTDITASNNITASGYCNSTNCYSVQDFLTDNVGTGITNNTGGWTLNFSRIYSLDWSNVSVTESQITDLVHTVDTNRTDADILSVASVYNETDWVIAQGYGTGSDNSSWNESYANTLYADISIVDTNDSSYIASNEASWLSTYNATYDANLDTNESTRFNTLVGTDCGAGDFVDGVDNDGSLSCSTPSGSGDFLTSSFQGAFDSNWTALDYDKWMYNQTTPAQDYADSQDAIFNTSIANYVDTQIAGVEGNASFNQSLTDTLYADISVTDTNVLTDATFNSTQMENSGGVLNILESWITSFINTWLGTKTTDDLSEGTNKYDNITWNESYADTLYAPIGIGGDNSSWNESYANGLYISSGNLSIYNGLINNASYLSTYNATYDAKVSFVNTNIAYVNNSNTFTQPQIISNNLNVTNITLGGCTSLWNGTCKIETCPTTKFIQC